MADLRGVSCVDHDIALRCGRDDRAHVTAQDGGGVPQRTDAGDAPVAPAKRQAASTFGAIEPGANRCRRSSAAVTRRTGRADGCPSRA